MSASVLFDQPGPRTLARHRIYSVIFAALLAGLVAWVIYKFNAAGQFESRIYDRLFAANILNALVDGLLGTLKAAAIAVVTSVLFGFLLAVARLSDHAWIRVPAVTFIEFFRAVPLLLLIIFVFGLLQTHDLGLERQTTALLALVTGLTLYNGAVLAEVFRAGIGAVPRGQSEAAYALGMRKSQVMTGILTPQAVRFMLPSIISQCVVVLKDTSLGFVVVYGELTNEGQGIATYVGSSLITYLLVALIYIALNSLLSAFAVWLEKRLSTSNSAGAEAAKKVDEVRPAG